MKHEERWGQQEVEEEKKGQLHIRWLLIFIILARDRTVSDHLKILKKKKKRVYV